MDDRSLTFLHITLNFQFWSILHAWKPDPKKLCKVTSTSGKQLAFMLLCSITQKHTGEMKTKISHVFQSAPTVLFTKLSLSALLSTRYLYWIILQCHIAVYHNYGLKRKAKPKKAEQTENPKHVVRFVYPFRVGRIVINHKSRVSQTSNIR